MATLPQNVSLTAPQYQADLADIERKRRLAEALQGQSMQDIPTQTAGGWTVPISPLQGVAKLAQAYIGAKGQQAANEREKALGQQIVTDRGEKLRAAFEQAKTDPNGAWAGLIASGDPTLVTLAQAQMKNMTDEKFGHEPRFTGEGKPFVMGDRGTVKWLDANTVTPREKQEFVETIGPDGNPVRRAVNPYAPGGDLQVPIQYQQVNTPTGGIDFRNPFQAQSGYAPGMTPYQAGNLGVNQFNAQVGATNAANTGINTQFNTGQGAMPPRFPSFNPQAPQMPQGAPQAPQGPQARPTMPVPQGAPVAAPAVPGAPQLTPKNAQEVAMMRARTAAEAQGKRDVNMQGINEVLDEAQNILQGRNGPMLPGGQRAQTPVPTHSVIGAGVDWLGDVVGASAGSADMAAKLKSIGGRLTAMMPRMEGPQSDKDVQLYREMAAQIGSNTVPISQRLEALQTVRKLFAKYESGQSPGASGSFAPQNGVRVVNW